MKRKWIRPFDLVIVGAVLLTGVLLFAFMKRGERGDVVRVYADDRLYTTLSLADASGEHRIETERGVLILTLTEEGACVTYADCPDGVCVRTGRIAKSGESIVCVPLGIAVTVGESIYDGVTG